MQTVHSGRLLPAALVAVALSACATGGVPRPFPGAPTPPAGVTPPPPGGTGVEQTATNDPMRASLVGTALALRGVPYRNGGSDPSGFDCSGFVQWVFSRHAWRLPRETRDQYRAGDAVSIDRIQPGDLVFFETVSRGASHVGVAIGGDQFVHAPSSQGVVRVERFSAAYWSTRLVGARRILGEQTAVED
jgi:cell wall-associated NlpC family hydrolase